MLAEPIIGDERRGGLQMSDCGDRTSFSVPPTPMAWRGDQRFAHRGEVGRPGENLLALCHRDERSPKRNAAHKRLRPVDRVQDPPPRGIWVVSSKLLAQNAVL